MANFTDSTELLNDAKGLRERATEEGYLYFQSLIPRKAILELRSQFAEICARHGWLREGTDPGEGLTDRRPIIEGKDPAFFDVYDDVQRLESFHRLSHHPNIIHVMETLFEGDVLPHPRNIARIIFPKAVNYSTPPHQDYIHIQGTPETWTTWMCLGDCPGELGGLSILPRSHKDGLYPVEPRDGAGNVGIPEDLLKGIWRAGDLPAGSALLFTSHTVHRGRHNTTDDKIRFSVDFRYQRADQPVCKASLDPHWSRMTWDNIYANWEAEDLKYYWKSKDLDAVDFDMQYFAQQVT